MLPLPVDDILRFCESDVVTGKRIYADRQFWINKLDRDFGSKEIRPSVYVSVDRENGLTIYRLFSNGLEFGLNIMIERGYLDVADWLFARGNQVISSIYANLNLRTQLLEIEWLILMDVPPSEDVISEQLNEGNDEFIRILLKHDVDFELEPGIMEYFTKTNYGRETEYTDPLIDIDVFEVLIQNDIFPKSYLGVILHPSYIKMLERNHIYPFQKIKFPYECI